MGTLLLSKAEEGLPYWHAAVWLKCSACSKSECMPAHTNRIKSLHASSGDTAESHVKTVRTDAW